MTDYSNIESKIARRNVIAYKRLMKQWGLEVRIYKPKKDDYHKVYGTASGKSKKHYKSVEDAILVGDDFFASDGMSTGGFTEGFLYSNSSEVVDGDTIEVVRKKDNKSYKYKVSNKQTIGQTQDVLTRWRLTALGA